MHTDVITTNFMYKL